MYDFLPSQPGLERYDLFTKVRAVDTGSNTANRLINEGVLPWLNLVAGTFNAATETLGGIDEALRRSPIAQEYQAANDMLPMAPLLSAPLKTGPALLTTRQTALALWVRARAFGRGFAFSAASSGGGLLPIIPPRRLIRVENLGELPLFSDAAWAQYQRYATGSTNETIFRLRYSDGSTKLVFADHVATDVILEAKFGNMGQMWNPLREAHVIDQATRYLQIAEATGMRGVHYRVSTQLGAERLLQRFSLEFPHAVESGMLSVHWFP
ncbi:hypothetical protein [Gordonia hongkongensis]|uniref:hypothetical protein n=1 Tax=Gordonia hongkongensis TaxID=1701090 RepID=UPI003D75C76C